MSEMVQRVAQALHAEFQRDYPKFTHRDLDAMDEATGVADRFRRMAIAALKAVDECISEALAMAPSASGSVADTKAAVYDKISALFDEALGGT